MANINTTLNITLEDGTKINLNEHYKVIGNVLSQESAIDKLTQKVGNGFKNGKLLKMIKRSQTEAKEAAKAGGIGGFAGASSQILHQAKVDKKYRQDHIIINSIDAQKLAEAKDGTIIPKETINFILTGKELDLKELIADLQTKAGAHKLHNAFDANTKPTGAQPAQASGSEADAIKAIEGGKRIVELDDFDAQDMTRLNLLRKAYYYLNTLGSPKNKAESKYLFSINGIPLDRIRVITTAEGRAKIKDSSTVNIIDVSKGNVMHRNLTGVVAILDSVVPIVISNQLPDKTEYIVTSDRTMVRDLDPSSQFTGDITKGLSVKMSDGQVYNLSPAERSLRFFQGRILGTWYHEEAFFLNSK